MSQKQTIMNFLKNMFGSDEEKQSVSKVGWRPLTDLGQLNEIIDLSTEKPVLIFKHSTRCSISRIVMKQFEKLFPRIPKLEKEGVKTPYTSLIRWFDNNFVELNYTDNDAEFFNNLKSVTPLVAFIEEYASHLSEEDQMFCMELVLWGLTISDKLDKSANDALYKFDGINSGKHFYGQN